MTNDRANLTLGEITEFQSQAHGYEFKTPEGKVAIKLYSDQIIQVRAVKSHQEFDDFSYSVIAHPQTIEHQFEEQDSKFVISTQKIILEIEKNPLRCRFLSKDGQVLNEDDPGFGVSWIGTEVTNYKKLLPSERFIGLGEKTGNLDRRGSYYTNWNTDNFGYGPQSDPLYQSHPFYMGLHDHKVYGIFFDNTYQTRFNFGASNDRFSFFQAEDGQLNYFFIHEDNVAKVIEAYSNLVGKMPLPPLWSIGFQQCRYSYYPDTEVLNLAETFRTKDIPADVIYLDIHYMDQYKVFTWDEKRFSDPQKLINALKEKGFHLILMIDPGVKVEEGYRPYHEGLEKDLFVKYPDDTVYQGEVWPGWCHFPDFTKANVREWWGEQYRELVDMGLEGFWNDMNEPAVWGNKFPDLTLFDYDGQGATHKRAHNIYGLQMVRSTFENVKNLLNGKRPFVLTRAGFAGSQRYSAVWTGDNVSSDEHMLGDIRLINSLGLTGVPFTGCDVGGFVGEATPDLYKRWIAVGAFTPFFRCHTMVNTRDAEPWALGEETEEVSRNYIKLRYRLLPYVYTNFYEASQTGMPISRSLAINYTDDPKIYEHTYQNQYLFGPSILVCPVTSRQDIHKVYFPEGTWYDMFNDTQYEGSQEQFLELSKDRIPLFVKAGGILTMQSVIAHTNERPSEIMELHLYRGEENNAFQYYEDDGQTYAFEQGQYYKRTIRYEPSDNVLKFEAVEGAYDSKFSQVRIFFHGFDPESLNPRLGEESLEKTVENYRFVEPISQFDPLIQNEDLSKEVQNLPSVQIALTQDEVAVYF